MKIKRKYFSTDYLWLFSILFLLTLKLTFSYLIVEHSYWIRNLPANFEALNIFGLPKNFSNKIEFILLPVLVLYILMNYKALERFKSAFILTFSLLTINLFTYIFNDVGLKDSVQWTLKIISPIYFFLGVIVFTNKQTINLKKTMMRLLKYCALLVLIGLLFFEISMNRKQVQLPIYFSNIHTHSYIVTVIFIGISYIIYRTKNTLTLIGFILLSFSFLYFGYKVRTAILLYLIYIIGILYTRHAFFKYLWIQLVVFIPLVAFAIFLIFDFNFDQFSSGRLTMYQEKVEILSSYNFIELLFGRGYGSDLIRTDEWWWAEKGSHSDFITYAIENGVLYVGAFIALISSLMPFSNKINLIFFVLITGYFSTSLISNGIAVRPLAGYVFFFVLVYIYRSIYTPQNKSITNSAPN